MVAAHNAAGHSFTMALNAFADLTQAEFAATHLGLNPDLGGSLRPRALGAEVAPFRYANVSSVPSSVDWRAKGVVTPVKNQQMCGSCWAFSTTGAIEGINAIRTGKLISLSEQELVSCDTSKDMGCGGGLMDYAYDFVVKNGGIDSEDDYWYWSVGLPCQTRKAKDRHVVTIDGHEDVPVNDAAALKKAATGQPISVAICAPSSLQFYSKGVVSDASCCSQLNHGVLLVGYADEAFPDGAHWIIKNSWGGSWGEQGFFKLAQASKSPEGACGVLKAASYPIKEGTTNPEVPEFCGWFGLTECAVGSTCDCQMSFFGLFCVTWGCKDKAPMAA
jgi:cathepsin L